MINFKDKIINTNNINYIDFKSNTTGNGTQIKIYMIGETLTYPKEDKEELIKLIGLTKSIYGKTKI